MVRTVRIIEDIEGHYETQEGEYGKLYRWRPRSVVVECDCGKRTVHKRTSLIASMEACECGAEQAARVQEDLGGRLRVRR